MDRYNILIISADPLAAALLAAAVELSGHAPVFVHSSEGARIALRRVRPRLVLIDCDHEDSCSDEFIGPALMMNAKVLLFRSPKTIRNVDEFAMRLSLRVLDLPSEHDEFMNVMKSMLSDAGRDPTPP